MPIIELVRDILIPGILQNVHGHTHTHKHTHTHAHTQTYTHTHVHTHKHRDLRVLYSCVLQKRNYNNILFHSRNKFHQVSI